MHRLYPDDIPEDVRRRWWPEGFEGSVMEMMADLEGFPEVPDMEPETAAMLDRGRKLTRSERRELEDDVQRHASELGVAVLHERRGPAFDRMTGRVFVPPLTSDTRYAATMHELGHAATITSHTRASTVHLEAMAWEWALPRLRIALSDEAEATNRAAFTSYATEVRGHRDAHELRTVAAQFANH